MAAILALDLGTQMGWALAAESMPIVSGSVSFKPNKFEGAGFRYIRFVSWLDTIIQQNPAISSIYFEAVRRHLGVDAAHIYGGFMSHLLAWSEKRGIPINGVPVGTIKKSATGKGNADKIMMISSAKNLGFDPIDDNEADAIHLLNYAIKTYGFNHGGSCVS